MKRIVILSDTHGNYAGIEKLLPIINENDFLFHLGDHDFDLKAFEREIKAKIYSVKGNCDGGGDDLLLEIDGVKILLTHGDRYGVKSSLYKLTLRAKELGVKAVFYGHTHVSNVEEIDGVVYFNPGSLSRYGESFYGYVVIYDGKISVSAVPLI